MLVSDDVITKCVTYAMDKVVEYIHMSRTDWLTIRIKKLIPEQYYIHGNTPHPVLMHQLMHILANELRLGTPEMKERNNKHKDVRIVINISKLYKEVMSDE